MVALDSRFIFIFLIQNNAFVKPKVRIKVRLFRLPRNHGCLLSDSMGRLSNRHLCHRHNNLARLLYNHRFNNWSTLFQLGMVRRRLFELFHAAFNALPLQVSQDTHIFFKHLDSELFSHLLHKLGFTLSLDLLLNSEFGIKASVHLSKGIIDQLRYLVRLVLQLDHLRPFVL